MPAPEPTFRNRRLLMVLDADIPDFISDAQVYDALQHGQAAVMKYLDGLVKDYLIDQGVQRCDCEKCRAREDALAKFFKPFAP
jgi:hypothetical protein